MQLKNTCIDLIGAPRCTGCFACQSVCKSNAIEVSIDVEGFYKPNIDRNICNGCGICKRYCPVNIVNQNTFRVNKYSEPDSFAAWSNDEKVRLASSSGGVFFELAKMIIDSGGIVVGCVWNDNWTPMHILTDTLSDIEKMRGSKYVPSYIGNIYLQVIDILKESDKQVLFTGTPCQVSAMNLLLKPEYKQRVILVDFICHGVPSIRVFHSYLKELFDGDKVSFYTFRDKTYGWQSILGISKKGRIYSVVAHEDKFFKGFASYNLYLMEACYQCEFTGISRCADITLGDYWGCPKKIYDERGVSIIISNTNNGLMAIDKIKRINKIDLIRIQFKDAIKNNQRFMSGYLAVPKKRRMFLISLNSENSFNKIQKKYFPSKLQIILRSLFDSDNKYQLIIEYLHRVKKIIISNSEV
jgi:coenzyme F420-reducing hydrogenase beta subunit